MGEYSVISSFPDGWCSAHTIGRTPYSRVIVDGEMRFCASWLGTRYQNRFSSRRSSKPFSRTTRIVLIPELPRPSPGGDKTTGVGETCAGPMFRAPGAVFRVAVHLRTTLRTFRPPLSLDLHPRSSRTDTEIFGGLVILREPSGTTHDSPAEGPSTCHYQRSQLRPQLYTWGAPVIALENSPEESAYHSA